MNIFHRKSKERVYVDEGWLKTYLSFSFGTHKEDKFSDKFTSGFGCLRVMNEDRIKAGAGFPTHSHDESNIFTYVIDGELTHRDSMGSNEIIKAGNIQFTQAGTGVTHSEYNKQKSKVCHLLQIWAIPNRSKSKPRYATGEYTRQEKTNVLLEVVSTEEKKGCIHIQSNLRMYACVLMKDQIVKHRIIKGHKVHLHLIDKKAYSIQVNDVVMEQGDALFITSKNDTVLTIMGLTAESEFLLFDMFDTNE